MANELQKLSKNQAVELAHRMKSRAKSIKQNAERLTERLVHGAIGTGAGFAMGYWMGQAEVDYQTNVAKLVSEGMTLVDAEKEADDPRKLAGVDKDLLVGMGLATVALTNLGGRKVSPFIEAAAFGTLAGWAHSRGMEAAIESSEEEEEEA